MLPLGILVFYHGFSPLAKISEYGAQLDHLSQRKHSSAYDKAAISEKRKRYVNIENLIEIEFISRANFLSRLPVPS
jgi:hypothetical protein